MSAAHSDAVDRAVAALRYGSININVATMLGFCVSKLTWGAYPGNTPQVRAGIVPVSQGHNREDPHLHLLSVVCQVG